MSLQPCLMVAWLTNNDDLGGRGGLASCNTLKGWGGNQLKKVVAEEWKLCQGSRIKKCHCHRTSNMGAPSNIIIRFSSST